MRSIRGTGQRYGQTHDRCTNGKERERGGRLCRPVVSRYCKRIMWNGGKFSWMKLCDSDMIHLPVGLG
jgi:hypothetical protein